MVDDESVTGDGIADESFVMPGPRRSTFTPPTGSQPRVTQAPQDAYDDDDLANALASQFPGGVATGSVPIVPRPLSDLPAPSGSPVVFPESAAAEGALPPAPRRRSLADADLVRSIDAADAPGRTLSAMEQLEAQLQLRAQEAKEFTEWQQQMLAIGTPEALRTLEAARPAFTGVVEIVPQHEAAPQHQAAPQQPDPSPAEPTRRSSLAASAPVEPPVQLPVPTPTDRPALFTEPPLQTTSSDYPAPSGYPGPSDFPAPPGFPSPSVVKDPSSPEMPPVVPLASAEPERLAPPVYDLVEPVAPLQSIPAPEAGQHESGDLPASLISTARFPAFDFDSLLASGAASTALDAADSTPVTSVPIAYDLSGPQAEPLFIEPTVQLDPGLAALQTGSRPVIPAGYDLEPQDEVDPSDRGFDDLLGFSPVTSERAAIAHPITDGAPLPPFATPLLPTDEVVLLDDDPTALPAFAVERAGPEPTELDHRIGRAARLFWLWFATNSSVLSIAFGGALFSLGMSLRQAVVAAFIGVAISFLPLGLGTLAGKWSGQPTMIASRATFGTVGNAIPSIVAIVAKVFWGAVLLWLIAVSTAHILVGARLNGPLSELQLTVITMAAGFIIALIIAVFGYGLFARVQLLFSILSAVLVAGLVVITWPFVHVGTALTVGDGPWILVVTGVVLVFSFVGLAWVNSAGDLARYQRPSSSGAAAMLWAPFGATLPAFVLIGYGALLAASNPDVAHGLVTSPLDTIALMIPIWYPVPLIAATVLGLLSGVVLSIYSGGFALQALGLRVPRAWSSVIAGVLVFAVAVLLGLSVVSIVPVFRDLATTISVPIAAWAGIFTAEMIIRRRRFDSESLLHGGGVYPRVNWVNLVMLIIGTAIGFGFTTATIPWLRWQGYLFTRLGVKLTSDLAGTDVGVILALVFGLLTTFIVGVPAIRKQERSRGA